jgi:hypothetical protein
MSTLITAEPFIPPALNADEQNPFASMIARYEQGIIVGGGVAGSYAALSGWMWYLPVKVICMRTPMTRLVLFVSGVAVLQFATAMVGYANGLLDMADVGLVTGVIAGFTLAAYALVDVLYWVRGRFLGVDPPTDSSP